MALFSLSFFCGSPVVLHGFTQMRNEHNMITVLSSTQPVRWSIRQKATLFVRWLTLQNWKGQWNPQVSVITLIENSLYGNVPGKNVQSQNILLSKAQQALHDCSFSTPSCLSSWVAGKRSIFTRSLKSLLQVCRSHIQTQKWRTVRVSKLVSRKLWQMSIPWTSWHVQSPMGFLFLTAAVWVQNFVAPSRWTLEFQKMAQCCGLAKIPDFPIKILPAMIGLQRIKILWFT